MGNSLVVQWLELHASIAGGTGLIPGWGTKIPQAVWRHSPQKTKVDLMCWEHLMRFPHMDGKRKKSLEWPQATYSYFMEPEA